jgi:proline iminopeptidase
MLATVRDTRLFFDVEGCCLVAEGDRMREQRAALVVHGGPGSDHTGMRAGMVPLTRTLQLVYFDHRGHGRSQRHAPQRYTLDENVEDMEALRRFLGLQQTVSIGTSYGGMVAMAHAARYPDAVSHLILIATASHSGFIARSREIVAERGTAEQVALCEDLWAGRIDTVEKMRNYKLAMGSLYSTVHNPVKARLAVQRAILSPEPLNRAYAPGGCLRDFDLRPELSFIRARTLIVAGRHDWICPPEFSEEMHQLIPGSELRTLERSGHSIRADEPQALVDSIAAFI